MNIEFDEQKKQLTIAILNYKFAKVYRHKEYMKWRKDMAWVMMFRRPKRANNEQREKETWKRGLR